MNRRSFFGALAAVVAAGKAAPGILAKLATPAKPEWPLGILDVISTSSIHGLSGTVDPVWRSIDEDGPSAYTASMDFPFSFKTVNYAQWRREENARLRRETVGARSGFSAWERRRLLS